MRNQLHDKAGMAKQIKSFGILMPHWLSQIDAATLLGWTCF